MRTQWNALRFFPRDEAKSSLHPSKTHDVTGRSKSGRKCHGRAILGAAAAAN
jgi:hypothetical protein